uniref:Glycosyl hydrolases family 38 C-terminal beta sandwich domain-containing protein n=1 Tax=Acrobeloides nanus TaxID=290746 RepID=A0A914E320_9BILA
LHRRDFYDDGFGVDQALDEPGRDGRGLVVRGKHWLLLAPTTEAQMLHRALAYSLFHQPVLTFSNYNTVADYGNNYITQYTGIKTALPPQLNLLTLKPINDTSVLIRLEHFYQKTEDATVASVDLANIFNNIKVNSAQELNLQATEVVSTLTSTTVQLNPMQIKTYLLQVQKT